MKSENYLTHGEIIEIIKRYINNNFYNYAVLINGEWGCGKTNFIKGALSTELKNIYKDKKVIYIPLYGVKNIQDISNTILIKCNGKHDLDSKWTKLVQGAGKGLGNMLGISLNNCATILSEFIDFKKYIFIFDDLERCDCDINEILGYINNFVEHNNAKVILVANEKEINNSSKNYERIKEKLIGNTINYYPNSLEVKNKLIDENISNEKLELVLKENLKRDDKYSRVKGHINFRTYQFFLEKISELNKIINKVAWEEYDDIISDICHYCYKICILYKIGEYIDEWPSDGTFAIVTIDKGKVYEEKILGYKFIDEYVVNSRLFPEVIERDISAYLTEKKEVANNPEDPMNIYNRWWEFTEEDLNKGINEIISKLEKEEYEISKFPKILYYFADLESIGLNSEICNKVQEIMIDLVRESNEIINLNMGGIVKSDDRVYEIYQKKIEEINSIINNRRSEEILNRINNCFNNMYKWTDEFYKIINEYSSTENNILDLIDEEQLLNVILKSNSYDIYRIRFVLEELSDPIFNIKPFLRKLYHRIQKEDLNKYKFDLIQRHNIELLKYWLEDNSKESWF